MKITVETTVDAPLADVWHAWNNPDDIVKWNAASDDWHTTRAATDLRVGGVLSSRMEAKDGSMGFDFAGTYTQIETQRLIEYELDDGRTVRVEFAPTDKGVTVCETFDAESTHSEEQQRAGWQAILDRFANHVTSLDRSRTSQNAG
ncbi:SRPBCC family protein [Planctomycetes bacterium K23_9]